MAHVSFFWLKPENDKIIKGLESEFYSRVKAAIQKNRLALPPIPAVLVKLQSLCKSDDTTIHDVAELLIDDPGLAAHIVSISNTTLFNRRNVACHDVTTAISRLGIYRVRDIVTAKAIEDLKKRHLFSQECNHLLTHSATRSRQLAATMALVAHGLATHEEFPKKIESDKALLAGLFADIGLFSLIYEYQAYLDSGNYLDIDVATHVFEHSCQEVSLLILKHWGFDSDYLEVASNSRSPFKPANEHSYYLDVARMANHLLLFRTNDDAIEEHHVELDLAGAEVMYELSNLSDAEFVQRLKEMIKNSGM